MLINFLTAAKPLAKEYFADGRKEPYPHIAKFTSHPHHAPDIQTFYELLIEYSRRGGCLLKGELTKQLLNESRQGSTNPHLPTHYEVIDIDRCDPTIQSPEEFITRCLPAEYQSVDFIWQYSNSAIIQKKCLAGHLFYLRSEPIDQKLLKGIYTLINHTNPLLNAAIELSHNGLVLSYGLDITTAQNDKLIFIANPILHGIADPIQERIILRIGTQRKVRNDTSTYDFAAINNFKKTKIDELRTAAGLPRKTAKMKNDHGVEILSNPDTAIFRGPYRPGPIFTYGNLNDGDSFAYYHLTENPNYLYNFKGEPIVRLKDIDPDYWWQIRPKPEEGMNFLAFRDPQSDTFYTVAHSKTDNTYISFAVSNEKKAQDFLSINHTPIPETLPIWNRCFEPTKNYVIDFKEQRINTYQKTHYLKNAKPTTHCPPCFHNLTLHVVGGDVEVQADLLNWLAYIIQTREKTQTAYLLHGRTGTGKGVLFNTVLRPILGHEHAINITMDEIDCDFNGWIETALLVMVDEAQITDDFKRVKKRNNHIKHIITEPQILIKNKHIKAYTSNNYANFIFASNEYDSIKINDQDRRFKVAPRQENSLHYQKADIEELEKSLQDITNYLIGITLDVPAVKTVLMSEARAALIETSKSSIDEFVTVIKQGDLDTLMQYLNEDPGRNNADSRNRYEQYVHNWQHFVGRECRIPVSHLRSVYCYIFNEDISAVAFGKLVQRKGLNPKTMWCKEENKPQRCVNVTWKSSFTSDSSTENSKPCGHTVN